MGSPLGTLAFGIPHLEHEGLILRHVGEVVPTLGRVVADAKAGSRQEWLAGSSTYTRGDEIVLEDSPRIADRERHFFYRGERLPDVVGSPAPTEQLLRIISG
ncbi:hypothetical protein D9M68_849160 [compost metagenome]